jgi:hypothetical protein
MSKKIFKVTILVLVLLCSSAFSKPSNIEIKQLEITAIDIARILRYDFVLKRGADLNYEQLKKMEQSEDTPGDSFFGRNGGINFSVRPNKELAAQMNLVPNTKYVKMQPRGFGISGLLERQEEIRIHMEYSIKNDADINQVKKYAKDSTLLVLYGNNILTEIPLKSLE